LIEAMDEHRWSAGHGVPSAPTRFVVRMNPADRAWLDPGTEDRLARALERHAESTGLLLVGPISVDLECDLATALGRPRYCAGFAEHDLLVLAHPAAALDVFARR
jgi:hypothetical protein